MKRNGQFRGKPMYEALGFETVVWRGLDGALFVCEQGDDGVPIIHRFDERDLIRNADPATALSGKLEI
jgi:hypothetical protein